MAIKKIKTEARSFFQTGLAFLLLFCFISCSQKKVTAKETTVVWENKQAVALQLSSLKIETSAIDQLKINLHSSAAGTAILGDYKVDGANVTFQPLIPLTPNLKYDIYQGETLIETIEIPLPPGSETPIVTSIFPSKDSVPENLLKMYFKFSKPMQEVRSLDFIKVYDLQNDSLVDVFLDLQPELWDKERTRLTLWLDPGRIKTDLIPNLEKGIPIVQNREYKVVISPEWKDYSGVPLGKEYHKTLKVGKRDSNSPVITNWNIKIPQATTKEPMVIRFNEAMDAILATEVITVYTEDEAIVNGTFSIENDEKTLLFTPDTAWKKGSYYFVVDAKFEDLAGNNLNRLFDTDLHAKVTLNQEPFQKRAFTVN
ncbi:hypothetical protein GTQ40_06310 [Flavobacteriaceae bacterium R38]|nr:hypothetical protein [Flavobacteriaceae bacterium R38]